MRWLIYWLWLRPLIKRNLQMRNAGKLPDQWYWADVFALRWTPSAYFNDRKLWDVE